MERETDISLASEPVQKEPSSPIWKLMIEGAFVALMIMYSTHFIVWTYAEGLFPVRPIFVMLLMGAAVMFLAAFRAPDLTGTGLLALGFITYRVFDAAVLQRFIDPADHSAFVYNLGAVVFMALVYTCALGVFHKTTLKPILLVAAGTIIFIVLNILAEMMGMGRWSNVQGRPAGMIGDPNNACIAMTIMLGIWLCICQRFWWNIFMIGIVTMAVGISLSRSGMLTQAAIVAVFFFRNFRQHSARLLTMVAIAIPLAALGVGILMTNAKKGGQRDKDSVQRIEALFGGNVEGLESGERWKDLNDGLAGIGKAPVWGHGTGAGTDHWQPHNMFVSVWLDNGVLVLFWYVVLLGILTWKCIQNGFRTVYLLIPLVFYIPFSQILIGDIVYWFGFFVCIYLSSQQFWCFRLYRPWQPDPSSSQLNPRNSTFR